jgi:hypothetical protein
MFASKRNKTKRNSSLYFRFFCFFLLFSAFFRFKFFASLRFSNFRFEAKRGGNFFASKEAKPFTFSSQFSFCIKLSPNFRFNSIFFALFRFPILFRVKKKTFLSIFSLNFRFASIFSLNFRLFYLRFRFRFLVFRIEVNHVKSGFFSLLFQISLPKRK